MLLDTLQCPGQTPQRELSGPKKAIVLRPKNPGLELFTNESVPLAQRGVEPDPSSLFPQHPLESRHSISNF